MSDLKVDCDWREDTLYIALSKDPERIGVRLFSSRHAPSRMYVPMSELLRFKERYAKLLDEKIDAYNDMRAATLEADELGAENAKLRELVRGLHMAYIGALNECEGMDAGLIWDHCDMVDAELAKSHERFEADRHRFDVVMRELGVETE